MDDNQRPNQEPQVIIDDIEKIKKLEKELDQIEINNTGEVNAPQETVQNITREVPKEKQEPLNTQSDINVNSVSSPGVEEKVASITNSSYQVPATGITDALIRVGIIMMVISLVVTVVFYFIKSDTSNLDESGVSEVTEKIQSIIGR